MARYRAGMLATQRPDSAQRDAQQQTLRSTLRFQVRSLRIIRVANWHRTRLLPSPVPFGPRSMLLSVNINHSSGIVW